VTNVMMLLTVFFLIMLICCIAETWSNDTILSIVCFLTHAVCFMLIDIIQLQILMWSWSASCSFQMISKT
jgi:hypothetical protein